MTVNVFTSTTLPSTVTVGSPTVVNIAASGGDETTISTSTIAANTIAVGSPTVVNIEVTGGDDPVNISTSSTAAATVTVGGSTTINVDVAAMEQVNVATSTTATTTVTVGSPTVVNIDAGGGGTGDVEGPASSVNNRVVFFDGTTGKLIKDSGLTLSGTNTGDQTTIVGITGTKAQFDMAVTDGDFLFTDSEGLGFRFENRTSDPVSPTIGQVWLRTDL